MNGKQRVYAALRRQPADRIPIFMWFQPGTRRLLAEAFEVPPPCVDDVLGNDVRMTWVNNNYCMEGIVHQRDGQSHVDPWGIQWVKQGPFNQIAHFPLAGASAKELLDYRFPRQCQEELLAQDGSRWPPRRTSISSAATSRPTCSRCTGGCAGWTRR